MSPNMTSPCAAHSLHVCQPLGCAGCGGDRTWGRIWHRARGDDRLGGIDVADTARDSAGRRRRNKD